MSEYNKIYNEENNKKKKIYILEKMSEEYSKDVLPKLIVELDKMSRSLNENGYLTELIESVSSCALKVISKEDKNISKILKYEIYPPYERYKNQHKYVIDELITTELNGGLNLRNNVWDIAKNYGDYRLVSENKKDILSVEEATNQSYKSLISFII